MGLERKKPATSSFRNSSPAAPTIPPLANPIRGFGFPKNTAEQELSNSQKEQAKNEQTSELETGSELPQSHDISRLSLRRTQTEIARKQATTFYEQQPDWVIQRLTNVAAPQPVVSFDDSTEQDQDILQRQCAACEAEEEEDLQIESLPMQRQQLPDQEEENVQMKSLADSITSLVQRQESPELSQVTQAQLQYKPLVHDISRLSLRRPQAKLTISQPADIYEQEADRVAQQVMRKISEPVSQQSIQQEELPTSTQQENLQMKSLADSITPLVQRKGGGGISATSDLENSIQQSQGHGHSLSDDIRQPMEQAFGTDFSNVRIHTDGRSDQLNQSIQARAFTTGQNIFFRQGEYAPGSYVGKELLAHELTHVVQQNGSTDIQRLCSKCEQEQENTEQILQTKKLPESPEVANTQISQQNTEQLANEPVENADIYDKFRNHSSTQESTDKLSTSNAGVTEPPPDDPQAQAKALKKMRLAKEKGVKLGNIEPENSVAIAAPQDKSKAVETNSDEANPQNQELASTKAEVEKTKAEGEKSATEAKAADRETEDKKSDKPKGKDSEKLPQTQAVSAPNPQSIAGTSQATTTNQGQQNTQPTGGVKGEDLKNQPQAQAVKETPPEKKATNQNPEALAQAVSPKTVAEKEQATTAAVKAQTQQNTIKAETANLAATGINFTPRKQEETVQGGEEDNIIAEQQMAMASSITSSFFAEAGLQVQKITEMGQGIAPRIQGSAENAKASVMAKVEQQKAAVTVQIAQQRDQVQTETQATIAQIQSQYDTAVAATTQIVATDKQKIETEYATALQKVDEQERNQLTRIEEIYNRTIEQARAAGVKVGDEAIAFGEQKATAWESQIKHKDDNLWDGPLTDNRLKARAKAAREVAQQYKDGLIKTANEQAQTIPEGKAKDIEGVNNIAKQSREQLQTLQKQSLQNLSDVEQQVLIQLTDARTQLTQTANGTLQETLQTLNQQESAQFQLLEGYSQGQVSAIDRDTQKAIASLQDGVNQAAANLQTVLQDTQSQLQGIQAPNPDELSAILTEILGEFDNSVTTVQEKTEQGITASEQGITQGGQQAVSAIAGIAQKGLEESAIVSEQAKASFTNLNKGATDTFSQIQQTLTTVVTQTTETAVKGFGEVTQGVKTAFDQFNQNLEINLQKGVGDLEQGLRGAIQGGKQPTLESDIQKYADEAAAKEEPRGVKFFKTLAKVLLVVAVIVVAVIFAPAVIGAVGAAAGALGASAALAGGIGAVVGGAIVGAVAGAVIQMGNNLIDGKNLLDGVGKAMLAGAIGGALGGLGGLAGNALAQAGRLGTGLTQMFGRAGIDVAFDIAGGIFGNLATGQPITAEGILIGAGIAGGVSLAASREALSKLGKLGRSIENMQTRSFQAGERFGSGAVNQFKSGSGSKVDAPTVNSPKMDLPNVKSPETAVKPTNTEVPRGTNSGVDTPNGTRIETDIAGVKPPETEVKTPETPTPNGRTTHIDQPEVEPGVVAKQTTADGHEIKVLKDGRVVRCSDCGEIRKQYKDVLEQDPKLQQRLDDIDNIKNPDEKAEAATKLEKELSQKQIENLTNKMQELRLDEPDNIKNQELSQKQIEDLTNKMQELRLDEPDNIKDANELSQIRQAGQGEKTLNAEQVINGVKSRIASQSDKFELTYTQDQLNSILKKGKELGLSDKVIEDLIYTGSRNAKAIKADELIGQMEHWVNVISKRGFPEKFADFDEFQQFSQDLLKGVKSTGLPADDIRIQGSSLRKTSAQDIDIAAFVDEPTFDKLLIQRYDGKITIKETNKKVSLNDKSHDELVQLANDIAANPQKYNAQGGTFQNALLNGIISSKSDIIKPLKNVRKDISAKYPHLNVEAISVLIRGGRFDVKPDLPVTGN
jgi:hypothetical protein